MGQLKVLWDIAKALLDAREHNRLFRMSQTRMQLIVRETRRTVSGKWNALAKALSWSDGPLLAMFPHGSSIRASTNDLEL